MSEGLFLLSFLVAAFALAILALLSGSETAAYAINRVRLRGELARGDRRARIVARLVSDVPALVATLVAGRTLAQAIVSFSVTLALESSSLAEVAEPLSVLLVAPVVILLGELAPKEAFRRHADHLLLAFAPLLAIAETLLAPVARLLALAPRALRATGMVSSPDERARAFEELRLLVEASGREGVLSPVRARVARNALGLRSRKLADVLAALGPSCALGAELSVEEALGVAGRASRESFLVHRDGAPAGVVHLRELLRADRGEKVGRIARPAPRLQPDESVQDALERLRRAREDVALVVSAGGTRALGLVALEELAAELFR